MSRGGDRSGRRDLVGRSGDDEGPLGRVEHALEDAYWILEITVDATRSAARRSLTGGARTGTRLLRAAARSRSLEDFVERYEEIAFEEFDRVAGDGGEGRVARRHRERDRARALERGDRARRRSEATEAELRERGARLLERSADVEDEGDVHPSFARILDSIAPDEARLLRYLATEGAQPSVDVRDKGWLPVSSDLVAVGRSMVGTEAGLRREDRTQLYLGNLERLGLVWFADEPVRDVKEYQLLEAQPDVKRAIDGCTRPKVVRRSIHLTPFGLEFCRVCFPIDAVADDAAGIYDAPGRGGHDGSVELR